jgi:hypothetical protein
MRSRLIRCLTLAMPILVVSSAACGSEDDVAETVATTEVLVGASSTAADTVVESTTAAQTTDAPQTTTAPQTTGAPATEPLDAVELLSSMGLQGTDYSPDHAIAVDVADLSTPNAVSAFDAAAATPECGPPTVEAPLPYRTLSSGARIDFVSSIGATASASVVVMPVEAAAIGYLEALRNDEMIPTCIGRAVLRGLTDAPPGITLDMENFRFLDQIDGYGDDQVIAGSDLVISQDGSVLLTVVGGARYSRIGNVILVVDGVDPDAATFASLLYERAVAAIDAN